MRTARWNRLRRWLGLSPLPRPGQVWEVEYSGWNGTRKFVYYLLLRPGVPEKWNGKTTERWHVYDLEMGCFYAGEQTDLYTMRFEYEHGDKECPYYRLVTEAP